MSFINGLLDFTPFTVSTSYQPACTVTHKGSRRGSHIYEINAWLWNFGRPQPREGGGFTERLKKSRSEAARPALARLEDKTCPEAAS